MRTTITICFLCIFSISSFAGPDIHKPQIVKFPSGKLTLGGELFLPQGEGILEIEGIECPFSNGDVLFVPALRKHRFISFSKDIKMWAVFWGELGGENNG